jgi:hypothetical protein
MEGSGQQQQQARRRPQWRGERKAVLVRMPVGLAEDLVRSAEQQRRSVSEHATALLQAALGRPERS